uniref:Uncharacterized protein n=1 Tax=Oryza rufipogon TaxID=4529 RepID=A0A0E0N6K1_ORYRU
MARGPSDSSTLTEGEKGGESADSATTATKTAAARRRQRRLPGRIFIFRQFWKLQVHMACLLNVLCSAPILPANHRVLLQAADTSTTMVNTGESSK